MLVFQMTNGGSWHSYASGRPSSLPIELISIPLPSETEQPFLLSTVELSKTLSMSFSTVHQPQPRSLNKFWTEVERVHEACQADRHRQEKRFDFSMTQDPHARPMTILQIELSASTSVHATVCHATD